LGACYTYKQEHPRAVEYLRKAAAFAPDSAAGRVALGDVLFQSGQTQAATPGPKTALALGHQFKKRPSLPGRAYQKLGQQAEAKIAFGKLDELSRNEAEGRGKKQTGEDTRKSAGSKQGTTKPAVYGGRRATKRKS